MGITMTKKMEKKYIPLANYFEVALQQEITLSFSELENIMGQALPNAAYLNRSWWKKTKPLSLIICHGQMQATMSLMLNSVPVYLSRVHK